MDPRLRREGASAYCSSLGYQAVIACRRAGPSSCRRLPAPCRDANVLTLGDRRLQSSRCRFVSITLPVSLQRHSGTFALSLALGISTATDKKKQLGAPRPMVAR